MGIPRVIIAVELLPGLTGSVIFIRVLRVGQRVAQMVIMHGIGYTGREAIVVIVVVPYRKEAVIMVSKKCFPRCVGFDGATKEKPVIAYAGVRSAIPTKIDAGCCVIGSMTGGVQCKQVNGPALVNDMQVQLERDDIAWQLLVVEGADDLRQFTGIIELFSERIMEGLR